MRGVELRVLGSFRVLVDGNERRIPARKERTLIATLAMRPRPLSRERVVAELWPESDGDRGRQSLRHALYEIHAAVGTELIGSARDELFLDEGIAVDLRAFERAVAAQSEEELRRALALYAGDLCPEIEGVDGEGERVRLRGLCAAAGEALAAGRLAADPREAAAVARRVIEIDPYREEAHRILLRALALTGDLAAAAVHYRRLTTILRDELGIEPSAETRQLYVSLGSAQPTSSTRVRRPSLEPPPELVGRRNEYGLLMGVVSEAIDGRGGSALVIGDAGTGKSRLLDEIAAVSDRHGLRVIRARATAAEGALPFQLWIDALAATAVDAAALPHPWPAVLATLLANTSQAQPGDVAPELRRTRLFEGVARLLAHLAAACPIVVVLDDLHHADPDSIHLFHYVARTLRQRRLAVVVASRPVGAATPFNEARASLEGRGDAAIVELGPLAPDAVTELLVRFGITADAAQWLAPRIGAWTGGNPFFVLELLRALIGAGRLRQEDGAWSWPGPRPAPDGPLTPDLPPTVRQTILARVSGLPEPTRRVLDLVSVLGAAVRLELIAAVAARDELAVAEDLAPAIEAGLVRESRDGSVVALAFAHELVRDAMYQRLPLTVRAAIHRRAAAALERVGATSRAIAVHLTAGGDSVRGAEHWLKSAREAEARFAHDDAIRGYQGALDALGPSSPLRTDVLMGIGDAHLRRGSAPAGVASYVEALAAVPADALDRRAALFTRIAGAARYDHRHPDALEYARAAVEHYRSQGESERLAEALVALAWVRYGDGEAVASYGAANEARAIARSLGAARTEARALHVAIFGRWLAGQIIAAPDRADVDRLASALGDDEAIATLLRLSSTALLRRGDQPEAVADAGRALEIARRVGSLRAQLEAGEDLVEALRIGGSSREAIGVADEVLADITQLDMADPPRLLGELVIALALAGERTRATALADDLLGGPASGSGRPSPVHGSPALDAASALMTMGRLPDVVVIDAQRPSCRTCQLRWYGLAGRHAALSGDHERALALADELEVLRRERGAPGGAGMVEHIRAVALARAGHLDEARRAADAARAGFRSAGRASAEAVLDLDLAWVSATTPD